jgi:hypothetical protein
MFAIPDALLGTTLANLETSPPLGGGAYLLHLYTNPLVPTPQNVLADFTELTAGQAASYAPITAGTANSPCTNQDGSWNDGPIGSAPFLAGALAGGPVTVYGIFVTDTTGAILLGSVSFPVPFTFAKPSDGMFPVYGVQSLAVPPASVSFCWQVEEGNPLFQTGGIPLMLTIPDVMMGPILTAIESSLGTVATGLVHVHLYTNNLTPTKSNVLADFTELTNVEVPGYVKKNANWFAGVPFRRQDGAWEDPSSLVDPDFVCSGSAPPSPQIVYGFFLTDSTDAILLGSGAFDVPFTFVQLGDGFTLSGNPALLQDTGNSLQLQLQDLQPS